MSAARDPLDGVERVRERVAALRVAERAVPELAPEAGWCERLHALLGAVWPCEHEAAFAGVWAAGVEVLARQGLQVGRGTYWGWDDADEAFARAAWCLTRHLVPRAVIETGVARGLTTRVMLEALRANGAGRLCSIDLPPVPAEDGEGEQTGAAVAEGLKRRWTLVWGSSRRRLPKLLEELGTVDLFVHDSRHTRRNQSFELGQAWRALSPGGFLLADDVHLSTGFQECVREFGDPPAIVCRSSDGRGAFGVIQKPPQASAPARAQARPEGAVNGRSREADAARPRLNGAASGPSPKGSVGAVVIGGDYQGLGIARSLGRRGIPVCVVDDERSIARFSRYTTHAVAVSELRDGQRTVHTLMDIGRRLGLEGWVLYPTREETVAALSRHRSTLSSMFRVPTADWTAVRWAWDKRNTYRLAEALGIGVPRTWYPRDASELAAVADPPVVIKPAVKEDFLYATKAKAWRANSREELRERFERAAGLVGAGQVMVQELIPGDGRRQFACCAFVKDGEMLATMVARRRRQHPPEFGRASTFVETVDVPELEQLSRRLFGAISYSGLAELEYKLDPRTGEFKLLDFNARTWGYHTLGEAAGIDFPYLQFADQLGVRLTPCRARAGARWVRLVTDLPTAVGEIHRGRLRPGAYLRSLAEADTEAVFSVSDPLPGLVELALVPYLARRRGF